MVEYTEQDGMLMGRIKKDDSRGRLTKAQKEQIEKQEKKINYENNKQLDTFFKAQQLAFKGDSKNRREREIIWTFLRRNGFEGDDTLVYVLNTRDGYIRRAAERRGWVENPVSNSVIFDVKFEYLDK